MKVNWCKRKKMIEKSQKRFITGMYKKLLLMIVSISNNIFAMEKIVETHPLVVAAAAGDTHTIREELEQLKQGYASSVYNLLPCRKTEIALALEKNEGNFFEKITYAALAAAIKKKKPHSALRLLYGVPVCLHNNPEFLLHLAVESGWPKNPIDEWQPGGQQKQVLEVMIENGALVTQKHPQSGKTPLEIAQEMGTYYDVRIFLEQQTKKYEEQIQNFKPYFKEHRIPPYFDIVSYEDVKTLDDKRRFEHYKQHCRVEYNPTYTSTDIEKPTPKAEIIVPGPADLVSRNIVAPQEIQKTSSHRSCDALSQNLYQKTVEPDVAKTVQIEKEYLRTTLKYRYPHDILNGEKKQYESFLSWKASNSSTSKLVELKLKYAAMAAENNVAAMKAIEALILEWKLIDSPDLKIEKLDYRGALSRACKAHAVEAIYYLLNKKNIILKGQLVHLLKYVCNGQWKYTYWSPNQEGAQKNIAQLLIKKGVRSTADDLEKLVDCARSTHAPERLINYLQEVKTSRLADYNRHKEVRRPNYRSGFYFH